MEPSSKEKEAASSPGMQLALAAGSLATMVALMYWAYIYPYPDGRVPSLAFFVMFWFKEIILFGLIALVFVAALVGWISRFFRNRRSYDIG